MSVASWVGGTFLLVVGLAAAGTAIAGRRLPGPLHDRRSRAIAAALAGVTLTAATLVFASPGWAPPAEGGIARAGIAIAPTPSATTEPTPSPTPTPEPTTSAPVATRPPASAPTATQTYGLREPIFYLERLTVAKEFIGMGTCQEAIGRARWVIRVFLPLVGSVTALPITYQVTVNGVAEPARTVDLPQGNHEMQHPFHLLPTPQPTTTDVTVSVLAPQARSLSATITHSCPVATPPAA